MKQPARLLVATGGFPPTLAGSSILMDNLFKSYKGEVKVIAHYYPSVDKTFLPPCRTIRVKPPLVRIRFFQRCWQGLRKTRLGRWLVYRFVRCQVARYKPDVIMGTLPAVDLFIASYRVAKERDVPFYAYMHDLWQENFDRVSPQRKLANLWEPRILTGARRVLCMTEFQAQFYRNKYGIDCELLPHTVPADALESAPHSLVPAPKTLGKRTVLFVGNPSRTMNLDSLRAVSKAIDLLQEDVEFLMLCSHSPEELSKMGLSISRLRTQWAPRKEAQRIQSASHVLVAPLSHKNCSEEEVRTVFSTKLLEYFVSGRPTLLCAPDHSFHVHSARKGGWALIVDKDDPQAIADGMTTLLENEQVAAGVVKGALAEARRRDARVHAFQLEKWVEQDGQGCKLH